MEDKSYHGTAYANLTIIAINFIYFMYLEAVGDTQDSEFMILHGAVFLPAVLRGEYWRLLTAVFMHFGIEHIVNNMLVLYVLGEYLERVLGSVKYVLFYLICGAGANAVSLAVGMSASSMAVSAGASGAVFGVIGGLLYVVLANRGRLGDLSAKQLAVMIILSLYFGFTSSGVDNAAHVAGLVLGIIFGAVFHSFLRRRGD